MPLPTREPHRGPKTYTLSRAMWLSYTAFAAPLSDELNALIPESCYNLHQFSMQNAVQCHSRMLMHAASG